MLPVIAGALGGLWLVGAAFNLDSRRKLAQNFPNIPREWWRPRDRFLAARLGGWRLMRRDDKLHELYRAYAAEHPDHSLSHLYLAMASGSEGRWQESLEHAQRLARQEPGLSVGSLRVALAATNLGDAALAGLALQRFLELEPESMALPHLETALTRLRNAQRGAARPKKRSAKKKRPSRKPASAAPRRRSKAPSPRAD